MATEYKDVIRVQTTEALMLSTLKNGMIGYATDTQKLCFKTGGILKKFSQNISTNVDDLIVPYSDNGYLVNSPISTDGSTYVSLSQTLKLTDVVNASTDTDKFLVLDSNGNVDFRTGTEILNDIGGTTPYTFVAGYLPYADTTSTLASSPLIRDDSRTVRLFGGSSGGTKALYSRFVIEDDDHCGLQFLSPNTFSQWINFGDPQSASMGAIGYKHDIDQMILMVNTIYAMTIDNAGICTFASMLDANGGADIEGNVDINGTLDSHGAVHLYSTLQLDGDLDMTDSHIKNIETLEFNNASNYIIKLEDDADTGIYFDVDTNLWSWRLNGTDVASIDLDNGNLQIDGQANIDNGADIEGNVDINGMLDSHGAAYFYSTLRADGALDANGGADIEGNVDINGTLDSHGAVHLYSTLQLDGDLDMTDSHIKNVQTLEFNNVSSYIIKLKNDTDTGIYFDVSTNQFEWRLDGVTKASLDLDNGNFQIDGALDLDNGADIEGNVDINGNLDSHGAARFYSTLQADGVLDANNGADIEGDVDIQNDLTVHNDITSDNFRITDDGRIQVKRINKTGGVLTGGYLMMASTLVNNLGATYAEEDCQAVIGVVDRDTLAYANDPFWLTIQGPEDVRFEDQDLASVGNQFGMANQYASAHIGIAKSRTKLGHSMGYCMTDSSGVANIARCMIQRLPNAISGFITIYSDSFDEGGGYKDFTLQYVKIGNIVTLTFFGTDGIGVSNQIHFRFLNIPAFLCADTNSNVGGLPGFYTFEDNSSYINSTDIINIHFNGYTLEFLKTNAWTASGNKGIVNTFSVTYATTMWD